MSESLESTTDGASDGLQRLMQQLAKTQKNPPVEKWNPPFCGDIDMRIASDGSWYYMGTPIGRQPMVNLFSSVLRKDADGKTYLVTPVEKLGIHVDDAHFVIIDINAEKVAGVEHPVLRACTSVGEEFLIGADHPIIMRLSPTGDMRPYVPVRGNLEAVIARSVFYRLADAGEVVAGADAQQLMIRSGDHSYSLGSFED